ncbi:ribonuclease D [Rickettsia endosymbiont of Cardiosporidium cionae]|uniref:ribonuclease D n=1 Tax=Rickettsia endosymbiont of Cardiosporidium cionae TaxID=2777155 RepID=UPI00389A6837
MKTIIFQNDLPDDFIINGDLAIDTEATGLNLHRDRLSLLQFTSGEDDSVFLVHFVNQDYFAPNLSKLLLDTARVKIFHFARFDLAMIKKHLNLEITNVFCTKISSILVRTYTEGHGLKELCKEVLGVSISKFQQSSDWGAPMLSAQQKEYAAKDVVYLHQLHKILTERLLRENRYDIAKKIFDFLPIRSELDLLGWNDIDIFAHSIKKY